VASEAFLAGAWLVEEKAVDLVVAGSAEAVTEVAPEAVTVEAKAAGRRAAVDWAAADSGAAGSGEEDLAGATPEEAMEGMMVASWAVE
tara:strand:- start:1730 stop:1993 length:264 start_codon:yes stop_codon:yes gene_type:complete